MKRREDWLLRVIKECGRRVAAWPAWKRKAGEAEELARREAEGA